MSVIKRDRLAYQMFVCERLFLVPPTGVRVDHGLPKKVGGTVTPVLVHLPPAGEPIKDLDGDLPSYPATAIFAHHKELADALGFGIL